MWRERRRDEKAEDRERGDGGHEDSWHGDSVGEEQSSEN